jgi:hypothetical protein
LTKAKQKMIGYGQFCTDKIEGYSLADLNPTTSQMRRKPEARESYWRGSLLAIFWVVFAMGLPVHFFSTYSKIEPQAFVMPPAVPSAGKEINPSEAVAGQGIIDSISAALTVGGPLGLVSVHRLPTAVVREENFLRALI